MTVLNSVPVSCPSLQYPGDDDGPAQGRVGPAPYGDLDGPVLRDGVELDHPTLEHLLAELEGGRNSSGGG